MKKRLLSALLTLCMGFSLLPVPAAAVEEEPADPTPTAGLEKAYFYIKVGEGEQAKDYVFAGTGTVDTSYYSQDNDADDGNYK